MVVVMVTLSLLGRPGTTGPGGRLLINPFHTMMALVLRLIVTRSMLGAGSALQSEKGRHGQGYFLCSSHLHVPKRLAARD